MQHPEIPDKLYFQIGEVADLVQVEDHILRYWEQQFPVLRPKKRQSGHRMYTKRDIEIIFRIKELLYEDKFTVKGAKKRIWNEVHGRVKVTATPLNSENPNTAAPLPAIDFHHIISELESIETDLKKITK